MFIGKSSKKPSSVKASTILVQTNGNNWLDSIVSVAFEYQIDSPNDIQVGNYFIDLIKKFSETPFTLEYYNESMNKAYRISVEILLSLTKKYSESRLLTIDDHYECTVLLMYLEYLLKDK